MKINKRLIAASILIGALPMASIASAAQQPINVAVYRGPASCEGCSETVKSALQKLGPQYHVDFVGPHERIDISDTSLGHYDIYVQPGGGQDIPGALRSFGKRRIDAIQNFVNNGGHYLGLCMGAYLADASGLGLIDGYLDSEVGRPGFPIKTIADSAVGVRWEGRKDSVFFQDGPYLQPAAGDDKYRSIATYENGDLAAARYSFGKGVVVLSGPHPEAGKSWFEEAGIPLEKMPKTGLFKDLIDELGSR